MKLVREPKKVIWYNYIIMTTNGEVAFTGRYRRDLETPNWHYYETSDRGVIHFRKEYIVYIQGGTIQEVLDNKKDIKTNEQN